MSEKNTATIQAVIRTLDSLTVCGSENMSRLLGCISALKELLETKEAEHG